MPTPRVVAEAGGLIKRGVGTLVLNGANTYAGGTTLYEGTLTVGANDALSTGTVTVAGNATLDFAAAATANQQHHGAEHRRHRHAERLRFGNACMRDFRRRRIEEDGRRHAGFHRRQHRAPHADDR
ncbi:MAG: hypothetical protein E2577_09045 [Starkeya sp.]|jgi:autotransporter-associated beta strand protein|nr:hypothetical protein [Starkeya sp.]